MGAAVHLVLLLAAVPGAALDLGQARARARSAAPEVQLAVQVVREVEASAVGLGVPLPSNPRLFGEYRRAGGGGAVDGVLMGAESTFEVFGAPGARLAEAGRRVAAARAELAVERQRAAARGWEAFVAAHLAHQRVVAAQEALVVQERVLTATQARVAHGAAADPEQAAAEVEVSTAQAALTDARRQEQAAHLQLRRVLDLPGREPLSLAELPGLPAAPEDEAALVARALERRPELEWARARAVALAAADERLAKEAWPKVGASLALDAAPASPPFLAAGLSVELPVAQRNQGPRAVVAAQVETERLRLELERRRVALEVHAALDNLTARRAQLSELEQRALPAAIRLQRLMEEGWRAGRFDLLRLTSAFRDRVRLDRERLELLHAAWLDVIELERASGGPGIHE